MLVASLTAGLVFASSWIAGPMLDQGRAEAAMDGLEQQPDVATALGTVAVSETLLRVDLESIARPIIGDLFDIVGDQAQEFLTDTAIGVVASGQVAPLWNVLVSEAFAELSSALMSAEEPTRPVGLNLTKVADDLLVEFGLPSGLVPTADWRLELLQPSDLIDFRDVVQPAIKYGPWLPWIALTALFGAVAIRREVYATVGWWLMGAAVVTAAFASWAPRLLDNRLAQVENEQNRKAFEIVVDALITDGVSSSIRIAAVIAALGAALLIGRRVVQRD